MKVPAVELAKYDLAGAKRHWRQIREALGFRPATLADEEKLTAWLAAEVCPVELTEDRQREALLAECRARKIEPPGRTRIEKVLVAARGRFRGRGTQEQPLAVRMILGEARRRASVCDRFRFEIQISGAIVALTLISDVSTVIVRACGVFV
ncbi:DUF4158 domain-containing protein [Sphaerisporangium sp. NPDC051011]|uniref:DUF4158 domain-containing protein n=1 Tax=Sphaerisporangium sp. NPDC051011 TaxID=3155792 RepID=UPI00340E9507